MGAPPPQKGKIVSRTIALAVIAVLVISAAHADGARAADPIPTTTTITAPTSVPHGTSIDVLATVSPTPAVGGTVTFTVVDPLEAVVFEQTLAVTVTGAVLARVSTLPRGAYTVTAAFAGFGDWQPSSATAAVEVIGEASGVELTVQSPSGFPIVPGEQYRLWAQVTLAEIGTVAFYETTSGTDVLLGTASVGLDPVVQGIRRALLTVPDPATEGVHTFRADYLGTERWLPSSDDATATVAKATVNLGFNVGPKTLEHPGEVTIAWNVRGNDETFAVTGTVDIKNETTDELITTGGLVGQVVVATDGPGTVTYSISYAGDEHYLSNSRSVAVEVTPDVVHATGLGVQYGTFYPVKDDYRDTNRIFGDRDERASVAISVYDSDGKRVRRQLIAEGTGGYGWKWNGRSTSGVLLAAGRYRVVQKLTDAASSVLQSAFYVQLSRKKLHFSTVILDKLGSKPTAVGKSGTGRVRLLSDGTARLTGMANGSFGWAAVGYQFLMPSAAVYKGMKVAVYGSGNISTSGPTSLGAQDFNECAYDADADWDDACFDYLRSLGSAASWTSAGLRDRYRHARRVRASVRTYTSAVVYRIRLTVTIGVLR
jgi:hypothetical protein